MNSVNDLVAVARLVKPRGLCGEIVADILTDFPERFEDLENVIALLSNSEQRELKIEDFWFQKNRIIFKFAGFDSIEQSETLRGAEICVTESEAVALDADEFFDWELQDCTIETVEGERIGTVKEIMRTGGTEILVVQGETKDYLIPFAEKICTDVNVENKLIRVDLPEGLLEF